MRLNWFMKTVIGAVATLVLTGGTAYFTSQHNAVDEVQARTIILDQRISGLDTHLSLEIKETKAAVLRVEDKLDRLIESDRIRPNGR